MLELIDSYDGLAAIADEWARLCEHAPEATAFQSPAWVLPWWRHLGGGEICTLAWRHKGKLRALAPLFRHGMPDRQVRQISFLGAGVTDYLDFIADPDAGEDFTRLVREWFDSKRSDWDLINLEELRPGAVARTFGPAEPCSVCPVIELPDSVEKWEASLDKTHRRNVRHACSQGGFTYDLESDAANFGEFVRLHELSWRDRDQQGVVDTPELRNFYREAAYTLAAAGILRLHLLRREGSVAAAIFGMSWKGRGYAYLGGFDPELRKSSPGTVLMWHAVTAAIRSGTREWDLLRGEEPYKYLWNARRRRSAKICIANG